MHDASGPCPARIAALPLPSQCLGARGGRLAGQRLVSDGVEPKWLQKKLLSSAALACLTAQHWHVWQCSIGMCGNATAACLGMQHWHA
eukprot:2253995-Lingulodinium_polyedra.AAC.1